MLQETKIHLVMQPLQLQQLQQLMLLLVQTTQQMKLFIQSLLTVRLDHREQKLIQD